MWVPRRAGNGVQWQAAEGPSSARWRSSSSPRWTRRLSQMAWWVPWDARHRHRLTTIKTKSAAVGSHEYWMGGRARTGTLLSATQPPPHLTQGIGNTWHEVFEINDTVKKRVHARYWKYEKEHCLDLKTIQTFMRSMSLMGCFLLLIWGHQFDLLSPIRATLVLKVLKTELLDWLSLSQKSQNIYLKSTFGI